MADLRRFRWHTGGDLHPVALDEPVPILFRDVGPAAIASFLRGDLARLAGPMAPVTWMRTAAWEEPYVDHGRIGRLVFVQAATLRPWHAGQPHIYVAEAEAWGDRAAIAWVPSDVPLAETAARLAGARTALDVREALGGRVHDEARADVVGRIAVMAETLLASDRVLGPLRRAFQSGGVTRAEALATMAAMGIGEEDLCRAWHHLTDARRDELVRVARVRGDDVAGGRPA